MSGRLRGPLEVAARLGLRVEGSSASGLVDGRAATLRVYAYDGSHGVRVVAPIAPPLDLGLDVRHRALSPVVVVDGVGDGEIDAEFSVDADDNARARALFDAALCAHVTSANRASLEVRLRDDACTIDAQESLWTLDAGWTERALRAATTATALVDAARDGVPAPRRLADHAAAAARYAATHGLKLEAAPLRMHGQLEGRPLTLASHRVGSNQHAMTASTAFEEALGLGLTLRRKHLVDGVRALFLRGDPELDDRTFDRRFLVRVDDAHHGRLRSLLPQDVRATLLDLDARFGAVSIDDDGIRVDAIPPTSEPAELSDLLDALVELGARLPRGARGGGPGPYR